MASYVSQAGGRPVTLHSVWSSDSESSGTVQEFYSPAGGSGASSDEEAAPGVFSRKRDEVYSTLRERAGSAGADFCRFDDVIPVQAAQSTLAVYFLFGDETCRNECWTVLENRIKTKADVWLSGRESPRSPSLSGSDSSATVGEACSLVLLLNVVLPLPGPWNRLELQREVERHLGCPRSRGGRLCPVLRKAHKLSFEVIASSAFEGWCEEREDLFGRCRKMLHDPETAAPQ